MNKPTDDITPRIYVASLSDYNAGRLHGKWIDCNQGVEDIREELRKMLSESHEPIAEEWAIHDFEGFGDVHLNESEDIALVARLAELIDEHRELITHLVEHLGGLGQLDEARRKMEEDYLGEWDSLEGWAEEFLEDSGQLENVPESLRYYIDFEKYARDLDLGGDIFTVKVDGKVHIFWS